MLVELAGNIWNIDRILKLEFQEVVDFLVIKKQQKDLEYYSNAKPSVEHKKSNV